MTFFLLCGLGGVLMSLGAVVNASACVILGFDPKADLSLKDRIEVRRMVLGSFWMLMVGFASVAIALLLLLKADS
jgi:hypothetical protein